MNLLGLRTAGRLFGAWALRFAAAEAGDQEDEEKAACVHVPSIASAEG
jgi:hypothetical protein